jgi:AcrR family transcriptional regulator
MSSKQTAQSCAGAETKPGRRERRCSETRERLFRAALRLFAERGFQATTVADITEAADVGKGTFFNYFPTKEHVLAAFGELQRSKVELAVSAARQTRAPMHEVLTQMVHALAQEPGRSPALFRSLMEAVASSESVRGRITQNLELGRQRLEELIAIGQERGEVRKDRPAGEIAGILQQNFFGAILFWSLRPATPLTERLDATFELFWSGVAVGPVISVKEKRQ